MSNIAIKAENLSKRYRIGLKDELHDTFVSALTSWVKYPLFNFRRLQKLSKFSESENSEDIIWALKDVSFEVKHGEVLGIIGRNGAGKSTLLKILCRITEPTSGKAEAHGRIASLLEVGTGFHGELTGRENVFLNGAILGMTRKEIEGKFDEIVDFSGVEKFIDTPVKRYSSGMHVRLAFAVAAHLDPEILLIDEVLAVGDVDFQKKCLGKMKKVAGEGRTVLFVSHNMAAIKQLCTTAIYLEKGRIVKTGTAQEVVSHYLTSSSTSSELPTVDLKNYKDRQGTQKVMFEWAQLLNSEGKPCQKFSMGENIIVVFGLKESGRRIDKNVRAQIDIHASDGVPVCKILDYYSGFDLANEAADKVISVCFEDIRFYPDKYYITLRLRGYHHDLFDSVEGCLSFEVTDGGKLTPVLPGRQDGLIFLTPKWRHEDINAPID